MKPVYQTNPDGLFLYETFANELPLAPGFLNVPFGAFEDAPPTPPAGMVARRVGNAWELVEDHRTADLWLVSTGAPYSVGEQVEVGDEGVRYLGFGPVPDWLTLSRPAAQSPLAPVGPA